MAAAHKTASITTVALCSCNAGFSLNADGLTCDDINECDNANGGCAQNCVNNDGGFVCSCNAGFSLNADGLTCDDINECDTANGAAPKTAPIPTADLSVLVMQDSGHTCSPLTHIAGFITPAASQCDEPDDSVETARAAI